MKFAFTGKSVIFILKIMKKQMITIGLLLFAGLALAQNPIEKGRGQFNAGVGFSSWGVPVYLGFDIGVHRDITVGGEFSLRFYDDRYRDVTYNQSIIGIAGNANYHFNTLLKIPRNWDFYAGLNLGFYIWNNAGSVCWSPFFGIGTGSPDRRQVLFHG